MTSLPEQVSEQRTMEQARLAAIPGWNISCQRCGSFGALWVEHFLPNRNRQRLCELCRDEHSALWAQISAFFRIRFTDKGEETRS